MTNPRLGAACALAIILLFSAAFGPYGMASAFGQPETPTEIPADATPTPSIATTTADFPTPTGAGWTIEGVTTHSETEAHTTRSGPSVSTPRPTETFYPPGETPVGTECDEVPPSEPKCEEFWEGWTTTETTAPESLTRNPPGNGNNPVWTTTEERPGMGLDGTLERPDRNEHGPGPVSYVTIEDCRNVVFHSAGDQYPYVTIVTQTEDGQSNFEPVPLSEHNPIRYTAPSGERVVSISLWDKPKDEIVVGEEPAVVFEPGCASE